MNLCGSTNAASTICKKGVSPQRGKATRPASSQGRLGARLGPVAMAGGGGYRARARHAYRKGLSKQGGSYGHGQEEA